MGTALLTLGAVIVGAIASTWGAAIARRRDLTRRYRTRLYQQDVPTLRDELVDRLLSTAEISRRVQDLLFTATLASKRDRRRMNAMWDITLRISLYQAEYDRWSEIWDRKKADAAEAGRQDEIQQLTRKLGAYLNWLDDWFDGKLTIRHRIGALLSRVRSRGARDHGRRPGEGRGRRKARRG